MSSSAPLKTPDGVSLRFARWAPPPGRKGTVCLFQGRAEFIEKYFETVRDLRARGFAVATLDWRGQGLSERALRQRRKGYVRNFSEYDIDLATFMHEVVLPDCPPPVFALAHSMGATVLMRAAYHGPPLVRPHGAAGAADRLCRASPFAGDADEHQGACGSSASAAPMSPAATPP